VRGRFQPGERLVEADLQTLLGAGRSAIRSAFIRAEEEGLITRQHNRGARVRVLSDREAVEITEVRVALEMLTASQAARHATPSQVKSLRAIVAAMRRCIAESDLLRYSELNGRLHQEIVAASRHETAARLLDSLGSHIVRFRYRTILAPGRPTRSLEEHAAIVEAIAAHDADAAERAMRVHLSHIVAILRGMVEQSRHADVG
jgi:DNA-binding GntR family transcriptional regulator